MTGPIRWPRKGLVSNSTFTLKSSQKLISNPHFTSEVSVGDVGGVHDETQVNST